MQLLEQDEAYLNDKGYSFELVGEGEGGCLIVKGYLLAAGKYDADNVDLLICIPKGYNDGKLDNFYVRPHIRLKQTGQWPDRADVFETHAGQNWQRFSRHLPQWRAGIDCLQTFMPLISKELQNKG